MAYSAEPGAYLFGQEEIAEVMDVLSAGDLFRYGCEDDPTFKRKAFQFEREMEKQTGVRHCVATSSGTGALMACLAALGIGSGDEVVLPGYILIASISSIVHLNATPILAEADESQTINPEDIEKKITSRTRAIMPIAKKHNLFVIENCCQAAGVSYTDKKADPSAIFSRFRSIYSKRLRGGDGGAVGVNDALNSRTFAYHDQGHNRAGEKMGVTSMFWLNIRVNELTGAIALAQMCKLNGILETLREKKAKLKSVWLYNRINFRSGGLTTLANARCC